MKRVELSIDIEASSANIWAVLTAPVRFPDWITGLQSVEVLTSGDFGIGTRYRTLAGTGNNLVQWTVEVTGVEPERSIEFAYTGDVEGVGGWRIVPLESGHGYRVTSFDEFSPPGGWLTKLLSKLWPDNAARSSRKESLERLKETLEDD
jgi:uncharacterized membrane protein